MQIQQGDVLIKSATIPADAQPVKRKGEAVLAEGEGHHVHRAATAQGVELFEKNGVKFARFTQETTIEHVTPDGRKGEHNPVIVPPGDYIYRQVVEYDYLNEMAREVVD